MKSKKPSKSINPLPVTVGAAAFIIIVVLFFGDMDNPISITKDRMAAVAYAVEVFAEENGRAPASMEQLGLSGDALVDHLGEPFMLHETNGVVVITSYGSDKKPGGFFYKRDHEVIVELP